MRRILVILIIKAIIYSSFILEVIMIIVFLCFLVILGINKFARSRQCAWEQTNLMLGSHQRLNVENPKFNNKIHDHSKSVNKSKYYENKDNKISLIHSGNVRNVRAYAVSSCGPVKRK